MNLKNLIRKLISKCWIAALLKRSETSAFFDHCGSDSVGTQLRVNKLTAWQNVAQKTCSGCKGLMQAGITM